jgi:hypothetical protein
MPLTAMPAIETASPTLGTPPSTEKSFSILLSSLFSLDLAISLSFFWWRLASRRAASLDAFSIFLIYVRAASSASWTIL